jgi:hypothetical protein
MFPIQADLAAARSGGAATEEVAAKEGAFEVPTMNKTPKDQNA